MIIKLRIMGETREDIRDFAEAIADLPEVTETDSVTVCPNYKGSGFRGYLTVTMKKEEEILTWKTKGMCHDRI
jgi:hypothetical protein